MSDDKYAQSFASDKSDFLDLGTSILQPTEFYKFGLRALHVSALVGGFLKIYYPPVISLQ